MTNEQLNEYVKHYLKEDRTHSAIMLNAPWGTGKSYYIQNELKPFLETEEKIKCIIVSLYGLKELSEISKNLYFELRTQPFKEKFAQKLTSKKRGKSKYANEVLSATIGVGKTIIKGVTSFAGVDLSVNQQDLEKLYQSIDLTEKLLIFEDIERSSIDILDFMGYVNTLVEQDGVKVMLVANEAEILRKNALKKENNDNNADAQSLFSQNQEVHDDTTNEYLITKEKTISDTINFEGDYTIAILNIIKYFNNDILNQFMSDELLKELTSILQKQNLRSFVFACQKTIDIYKKISSDLDESFAKAIFLGNVVFSLKIKSGETVMWDGNQLLSSSLGTSKYPLFRFCYDYIVEQKSEFNNISLYKETFKNLKLYDKNKSSGDKDLQVIYSSYIQTEKDVMEAIDSVGTRLLDVDDISFYEYGRLANSLVEISSFLDCDITKHKEFLVKNLFGRGDKIDEYLLFNMEMQIQDKDKQEDFIVLKNKMIESLKGDRKEYLKFQYSTDSIPDFCDEVYKKRGIILNSKSFLSNIDVDRFSRLMLSCTSGMINELRRAIIRVYDASNVGKFLYRDKYHVDSLINNIEQIKDSDKFDRIQKMQLNLFIDNLKEISDKLSH